MRKRLQIALMASLTATSFLSTMFSAMPARAQLGTITATTDESGRKIYVNGDGPSAASRAEASAPARSPLVYWSSTEHRFKPVPTSGAVMRAARSAASEVNTYLDGRARTHQTLNRAFTQQDIDAAIDEAAARHHVDPSLVRSVVKVESNFNPNAVSRKGAMGLMQLMPSTARSLNVSNPFDPAAERGCRGSASKETIGQLRRQRAASVWQHITRDAGAVARSAGVPQFRETQNYVRRITNLYNGGDGGTRFSATRRDEPVHVQRDARGVLYISNTE